MDQLEDTWLEPGSNRPLADSWGSGKAPRLFDLDATVT